nr:hypothetical protein [Curtobacterium sp. UCD-KPL2560]
MTTVLLALTGAVVYGAADFLGGVAARHLRAVTVAAATAAVGLVPLLVGVPLVGADLSGAAVGWGLVAGCSGGIGVLLLYRALAVGPMSVLSPLTAVFAAVVPVVVALVRGTVLSPTGWAALVVAVVAVVLVAAVRDTSGARVTAVGLVTAAVAGCGFGGIVLAYDATPDGSGVAPLLVARGVQTVLLGAVAVVVASGRRDGRRVRRAGRVGERLHPGGAARRGGPVDPAGRERAQRAVPDRDGRARGGGAARAAHRGAVERGRAGVRGGRRIGARVTSVGLLGRARSRDVGGAAASGSLA